MLWLVLFIVFLLTNILVFIYLPLSTFKEVILVILSLFIGILGFSLKDFVKDIKEKRRIKNRQKETVFRFNTFFASKLNKQLEADNLEENDVEISILKKTIGNSFQEKDADWRNSLIVCYYCKKWDKTKDPSDLEMIKRYAEVLDIKYGHITNSVKVFLDLYGALISKNTNKQGSLKHFTNNYYKDLQFYEIKEELHEAKNFHDTLTTIIKEGKLSTYGINKDTLQKLRNDLRKQLKNKQTFLLIVNKASTSLKQYLSNLPRISGVGTIMRNIGRNSRVSLFIVKTEYGIELKEFSEIIKTRVGNKIETIIKVVPVDFLNTDLIVLPPNLKFKNENMQRCYESIEWFESGLFFEDSLIWNEISKSSVTPDELLSIIPFNIFCPEILPSEQTFFIKHYDYLKKRLDISKLNEWKDKKPQLIVNHLMEKGIPEYTVAEKKQLKINGDDTQKKIEKRMLDLAKQIRKGAEDFDKALRGKK